LLYIYQTKCWRQLFSLGGGAPQVAQVYSLVQCSNLISIEAHGRDFEVKFFSLRKVNEAGWCARCSAAGRGHGSITFRTWQTWCISDGNMAHVPAVWPGLVCRAIHWCHAAPCPALPRCRCTLLSPCDHYGCLGTKSRWTAR